MPGSNCLGLLVECLGFGIPALIKDQVGEVIQTAGKGRSFLPWVFLEDRNRSAMLASASA